ncbi:hypothetical protein [Algoriphagus boritolerans]|uniref:hypothetical protein n=1 Tax=Algoriphagus boritolerans TaxID=308111 RepID=UPI002FCE2E16
MNKLFVVLLTLSVFSLASCAKKSHSLRGDGQMEEFQPVTAEYDYLSAKAKIVIEEESGKITRGTLSLRAKKRQRTLVYNVTRHGNGGNSGIFHAGKNPDP